MRFDYIITAITRLAIAQVREIRGVVFAGCNRLHDEWLAFEPLGKPSYSGPATSSLTDDAGRINPMPSGMKRGSLCQSRLTTASCPAGIVAV